MPTSGVLYVIVGNGVERLFLNAIRGRLRDCVYLWSLYQPTSIAIRYVRWVVSVTGNGDDASCALHRFPVDASRCDGLQGR